MARKRVVIVGAGFGGLACAKALDGGPVDVLLIDRNNYHVFTPLLYQVASSLLNPSDIAYPVRKIFRGSPNVRFMQAQVSGVDLEDRLLSTTTGDPIDYDFLVVATGSTTNFFGNDSIKARALGLKNLSEALQLRNHILGCLEAASKAADPRQQRRWMTFVIVGGGPTGVEFAGALAELMRLVLAEEYPQITVPARIILVEGSKQLLNMFSDRLGAYTERRLAALGVEVMTERLVTEMQGDAVVLDDGDRIRAGTLVWSAGVKPSALASNAAVRKRSKRVAVDSYLRISGRRDAFAIGDVAGVVDGDEELPMLSAPAMQAGRYVAEYITQNLSKKGEPNIGHFSYLDKGSMATIGRNHAVCSIGKLELTGFIGWLGWLVVHIYYLIGFRNRLLVLWSWSWNYLFYDRPVRIITRAERELDPALLPPANAAQ